MIEEMSCGAVTNEKPFTYLRGICGTFSILFKGNHHSSIGGGGLDVSAMIKIIEMLNEVYQQGFSDCGSELMPKLMEANND